MKKLILAISLLLTSGASLAAGGGELLPGDAFTPELKQPTALQSGAQLYVNYCLGCHSLKYQRYSKLAEDLQLDPSLVEQNLIFGEQKIGDQMRIGMAPEVAANWFGKAPPDLSLVARSRGSQWLYNYLRAFYTDSGKPYGVNNTVFPDVGMPHVLAPLQGVQAKSEAFIEFEANIAQAKADLAEAEANDDSAGMTAAMDAIDTATQGITELGKSGGLFVMLEEGTMSAAEYDAAIGDLVSFMAYVAEPDKVERRSLGIYVIMFLLVFMGIAYLLKKEYWKDIH